MKKALFVLLALAATFAAVWSIQAGDETEPPVLSEPDPKSGEAVEQTPLTVDIGPPASDASKATEEEEKPVLQREELQATLPAEMTVTLRGRCVDAASGLPLAGCTINVDGFRANSELMDKYLATHGEVEWEDPEDHVTGNDGVFSFTFVPPPPYQFMLRIRGEGAVTMSGRWGELQPGTVKDFGDVLIATGATVTGRILDTDGAPQNGVEVYLNEEVTGLRDGLYPGRPSSVKSNADGTFAFRGPVSSGEWTIQLRGRQLLEPEKLYVEESDPNALLNIVVKKLSDIEAITGIVVDEQGAPVRSAEVENSSRIGGGWINYTERDGTFRLERREEDSSEPSTIRVERDGYEVTTTEEAHPWGTSDLRLILRKAMEIEILVTDAETGEPVEDYGVRCYIDPATLSRWSSFDGRVQSRGHHDGGRLLLTGVRRGKNFLSVQPVGASYLASDPIIIDVTDQGLPRQHVELLRPTVVMLEVTRADGEPVSGTEVELIRTLGDFEVDSRTTPAEPSEFNPVNGRTTSILVLRGATDPEGRLELSGPAGKRLALRLLGPGHQPFAVNDVYLDPESSPLRVEVPSGATLTGRVGPRAVLQDYQPDPELLENMLGRKEAFLETLRAGIHLEQTGASRNRYPAGRGRVPLGDDGSFVIEGISPGDWDLYLAFNIFHTETSYGPQSIPLGALADLREGETRAVIFDIGHLAKAMVTGRVFLNGATLAGAVVQLTGTSLDARGERIRSGTGNITTSPDGSYATAIVPGDYRVRVQVQLSDKSNWTYLLSRESLSLVPGQSLDHVTHLQSTEIRFRILGSDGKTPVKGLELYASSSDGEWGSSQFKTDVEGLAHLEHAPLEALTVRAWPAQLSTQEARTVHYQQNPGNWTDAMVTLGTVQPREGALPFTLVMPEGSGY